MEFVLQRQRRLSTTSGIDWPRRQSRIDIRRGPHVHSQIDANKWPGFSNRRVHSSCFVVWIPTYDLASTASQTPIPSLSSSTSLVAYVTRLALRRKICCILAVTPNRVICSAVKIASSLRWGAVAGGTVLILKCQRSFDRFISHLVGWFYFDVNYESMTK